MRRLVLSAIRLYQRFISPHKGFCCAYRVHTGRASCSVVGYRVVQRYGVFAGWSVLRRRLYLCGLVHKHRVSKFAMRHSTQLGYCDAGCDAPADCSFEMPNTNACSCAGDLLGNCGGCDWPSWNSKKHEKSADVITCIPPEKSRE